MYQFCGHAMQYEQVIVFFDENDLLTPVTPNDHKFTFDPIIEVKGIKLMYVHECYGHAM